MSKELIYEINTRYWMYQLRQKYGENIKLGSIPETEIQAISKAGVDWVWLMGIWDNSNLDHNFLNRHPGLVHDFNESLPDWSIDDVIGSPYSIKMYRIHPSLGTVEDYKTLRNQFRRFGIKIILDFVPNHYGYLSPLVKNHPEYFIHWDDEPEERELFSKVQTIKGEKWIAHGKDPYFPPWDDTFQLNYYSQETRDFMSDKALELAQLCDGLRCDMSMLCTNSVIKMNWGWLIGDQSEMPDHDFWRDTISRVKSQNPDFVFIAEVYWGMEWELMEQGFDYAYDKTLYDNLVANEVDQIHGYLDAELKYQEGLCRFIENHDEARAATAMRENQSIAAAVVVSTLPGITMYHQGQLAGDKVKIPVQLRNKKNEPLNRKIKQAYHKILQFLPLIKEENLEWHKNEVIKASEQDHSTLLAWNWSNKDGIYLVVVNYADTHANGQIVLDQDHLIFETEKAEIIDHYTKETNLRNTDDLKKGLYVNLGPYKFHLFEITTRE